MRKALVILGAAALLAGCGTPVCDRSEKIDMSSKVGACSGDRGKVLGEKDQCATSLRSCSGGDEAALSATLECMEKLPLCNVLEEEAWSAQRNACLEKLSGLSEACREAFGGLGPVDPNADGGADAGFDAGRQPMSDGGGAVELIVVADETDFALAWTPRQEGDVSRWEVSSENALPIRLPEVYVPGATLTCEDPAGGAGVKKSFFVTGLDEQDRVVMGKVGTAADAGSTGGCKGPLDCAADRVCNLGACAIQVCSNFNLTCPSGYNCDLQAGRCTRQFGWDGGSFDAGTVDAGQEPRPFVSELVTLSTGAPGFGPEIPVSRFPVQSAPAMVAIDSARQYIALQQENQLFGHLTENRGKDLVENDLRQTFNIDTAITPGSRVKLAWHPTGRMIYACYNVGHGVRVRRSHDLGRTWPVEDVVDLTNPGDGGTPIIINDCDLAPWRGKDVLVVTKEEDALTLRVITDSPFAATAAEVVFQSSAPGDSVNIFDPERPAIATLPSEHLVHLGFTGSRQMSGGGIDKEVYGIYRDPTTGGSFTAPDSLRKGSGVLDQDYVTVAIEPSTKRAIAAYTTLEGVGATYAVVYVALWFPDTKTWISSSDLTVFAKNTTQTAYLLFPERAPPPGDDWDAFSPSLVVTPKGKIFLGLLAGPSRGVSSPARYRPYVVGFDFEKQSPIATGKGWFLEPARAIASTHAVEPQGGANSVLPTMSAVAADSQLSVYTTYVEGVGVSFDQANRAILVTRP